mgnify:FL=1
MIGDTNVMEISTAILKVHQNSESLGKKVVIIDETGDYLPLGLAELLGNSGTEVELVSPKPFIGTETQRTLDMPYVLPRLKSLKVRFSPLNFVEKIENDNVFIYDIWGDNQRIIKNVSSIVISMTKIPNDRFYSENIRSFPGMKRIGDVVAPRKIEAIIYEAEKTARSI